MGELADQIIDGECCALCMMPFENKEKPGWVYEHGYPVACESCWEKDCGYEKAIVPTLC
jgi:hypothetical protein